jgi:hypothetical protein
VTTWTTLPGCEHCGHRGADFSYRGHHYCCECMSELTSWLLDGGIVENPDQFPELADEIAEAGPPANPKRGH